MSKRSALQKWLLVLFAIVGISILARVYLIPPLMHQWVLASDNPYRNNTSLEMRNDSAVEIIVKQMGWLPKLENVILTDVTDVGLERFCNSRMPTNFKSLSLVGSDVSGTGLVRLAKLPRLESLCLNTVPAGDEGLASLKSVRGLKEVWLVEEAEGANRKRYTAKGLSAVTEISNLETLYVVGLDLPDKFFESLVSMDSLKYLLVRNCLTSENTLDDFREARPDCEVKQ